MLNTCSALLILHRGCITSLMEESHLHRDFWWTKLIAPAVSPECATFGELQNVLPVKMQQCERREPIDAVMLGVSIDELYHSTVLMSAIARQLH